jgi:4-hydroxy-2-oxoheptanedioate aldolase
MRLRTNSLKVKLREREFVLGTFLEIPSPQIVELLGLAGFDFVVIDREHGSIDLSQTEDLIRASLSTGISPMVRVAQCDPVAIRQPLDMGAVGIHVPQIGSAAAAEAAIRSALFYPKGDRGLQPYVRAASYRAVPTSEYLCASNEDVAVVMHLEGKECLGELDRILSLPGLDVPFIGPYDLSQSLGVPGEIKHPKVGSAVEELAQRARAAGKRVGIYCDDAATAAEWKALGVSYLAVGLDAGMLLQAARSIVAALH